MLKFYRYLYYRLYSWNLKTWGKKDIPQWNALFGVSFMICLNLSIIAEILDLLGLNIFIDETPKLEILIFSFSILIINYFWLVHNGKYIQIAKEYKNESKSKRLHNALLLWLYVILSFIIVVSVAILSGKLKGLQ